ERRAGGKRTRAIAREPAALDLLHAEGIEPRGRDGRGGVLDQEIDLRGRLVDGNGDPSGAAGKDVRVAELLRVPRWYRPEHGHRVAALRHGLGREVSLRDLELDRLDGDRAGPGGLQRVRRDARAPAGIPELEELEHVARAVALLFGDREQASLQPNAGPGRGRVVDEQRLQAGAWLRVGDRRGEIGDAVVPAGDHVDRGRGGMGYGEGAVA